MHVNQKSQKEKVNERMKEKTKEKATAPWKVLSLSASWRKRTTTIYLQRLR
jgi:hypothetical protein